MTQQEIEPVLFQLLKHIAPETEPSQLHPDDKYREILGIDSFDALQFIVALNDKLQIEIPEEDYGKIATLRTLVEYILDKKNS